MIVKRYLLFVLVREGYDGRRSTHELRRSYSEPNQVTSSNH
ncbi:hypothetical protein BofuT4_uP082320.1 [Botrytis cinerea T4]|uniref:Uncharacterized protein n=1 Tax=Botryotinia fuckeliana (strain T4) TaxID=999810 RepID=G2YKC5_BOTF4|nr:hypothetical protein BofuT4_uP082320.1 [Botrytis cinerea T4]